MGNFHKISYCKNHINLCLIDFSLGRMFGDSENLYIYVYLEDDQNNQKKWIVQSEIMFEILATTMANIILHICFVRLSKRRN